MTDRQAREAGRGRKKPVQCLAKCSLAVWMVLALSACGPGQGSGQGQLEPERIGSVAHRAEEEVQETPGDTGTGEPGTDSMAKAPGTEPNGSLENGAEAGQEDVLHLGQIAASEEEEKVTELTFRIAGEAEGLPQAVQDQIARINKGEQLWEVIGSNNLKDYYALTGTHTVEAQDKESGQKAVGAGRLTMYVPNLLEGLKDIAVLFYDDTAGKWCLIPAEKVDMEKRTVSMILTGSGTLTVIHRTQGDTKE